MATKVTSEIFYDIPKLEMAMLLKYVWILNSEFFISHITVPTFIAEGYM